MFELIEYFILLRWKNKDFGVIVKNVIKLKKRKIILKKSLGDMKWEI